MIPKPNSRIAVLSMCLAALTLASSAALALTREEIIQINSKAVAKILVLTSDAKGDYQFSGVGSGFFISHQGFIVTNYHVALEAVESDAALLAQYWYSPSKNFLFTVRVVKSNRPHDLALLQVNGYWDAEAEKILEVPPDIEFPCVVMGSSSVVQLGSEVIVIGFPPLGSRGDASGMINTTMKVTRGIISGFNDEQNFYETDAAVHGGNSGGPALSEGGVVIGVTSAIYEQQQAIGLIRPACDLRVILSTKILNDIDAERAENSLGEWDCGEGESGETTSPITKKPSDGYEDADQDYGSSYDSGDSSAHVSGKVVVRGANRGIPEAIIVVMTPDNADVFIDKFNNGEEQEWKDYLDKHLVAFAQTDSDGAFVLSDELDANSEYKFVLIKGGYDMNMYKVVTAGSTNVGNLEMDPASDDSSNEPTTASLTVKVYSKGGSRGIEGATVGVLTSGAMEQLRDSKFSTDKLKELLDEGSAFFATDKGKGSYEVSGMESGEDYIILVVSDGYELAMENVTAGSKSSISVYLESE